MTAVRLICRRTNREVGEAWTSGDWIRVYAGEEWLFGLTAAQVLLKCRVELKEQRNGT